MYRWTEKFNTVEENSHLRHLNTFGENPAACAVALKNIEIMERENLFNRSTELDDRLQKELLMVFKQHHCPL
ncbi:aminotransferase class III-fold pyridoxal phosphate-dependent enzyme [Viridibacillus sp. YIM B01967]|uniref:Aminotransferase class III-fold pyridoxal phosphate-dependent enzyme n=1 Tax=Viridibacillus soli TaxID=2798301 RepID=A0ABS1H455_9BACL|nr:aminotransferase class III-fold pyridoxal phosphate-dependent enzyme [Viridibacillus soli]